MYLIVKLKQIQEHMYLECWNFIIEDQVQQKRGSLFFLLNSLGRETLPIYIVFDYYTVTVYDFHTHFQKRLKYESRPTNGGIWQPIDGGILTPHGKYLFASFLSFFCFSSITFLIRPCIFSAHTSGLLVTPIGTHRHCTPLNRAGVG